MSDLWFLLRHVHGKQYELSDGSAWYGIERKWNDSGSVFRTNPPCKTRRNESDGAVGEKYQTKRYYDRKGDFECTYCGYGAGLFNKQYVTSSGNRT